MTNNIPTHDMVDDIGVPLRPKQCQYCELQGEGAEGTDWGQSQGQLPHQIPVPLCLRWGAGPAVDGDPALFHDAVDSGVEQQTTRGTQFNEGVLGNGEC